MSSRSASVKPIVRSLEKRGAPAPRFLYGFQFGLFSLSQLQFFNLLWRRRFLLFKVDHFVGVPVTHITHD
ncbi:hypothetical protein EMIT0194MI4_50221 [Pseudomonas sp. IT-194MI4]